MTDTLWQSFSNALTAVAEAEAVQAAIETAVLEGGLGNVRGSDDEWDYQYWWDEEENVASYWIQSIRIRNAGVRGNARGMLSIAIGFFRPEDRAGDHWSGGRRAKLYIGVAPTNKAWDKASLLVDGSGRSSARSMPRWRTKAGTGFPSRTGRKRAIWGSRCRRPTPACPAGMLPSRRATTSMSSMKKSQRVRTRSLSRIWSPILHRD